MECLGLFYTERLGNPVHLYPHFCVIVSEVFFFFVKCFYDIISNAINLNTVCMVSNIPF